MRVGLEGVGGGSFLRPAAGSRSGMGGETVGGRPGRGRRRRCRRSSRRGGCRCRSCRRRHCLLLRPRRGASERKRRRGARRTPQLDPSLQLQASAPPLPSQPRSQWPRAAGSEPRAHWRAAVAARAGRGRENHSWNSVPTPEPSTAPLPSPRRGVRSRRPEPIRRLPRPNPLSYWPLGSLGLPPREPRGSRAFGAGSWDSAVGPGASFVHDPWIGPQPKGGAQLWAGLEKRGWRPGCGV